MSVMDLLNVVINKGLSNSLLTVFRSLKVETHNARSIGVHDINTAQIISL
jgi:hypothetical protein